MEGRGEQVRVGDLMDRSGVAFGTSGARGKVADMTDRVCYAYTAGFLGYLAEAGEVGAGTRVALGGDLRPSTGRILAAVAAAARDRGCVPVHCGRLPSPALALYGIQEAIPAAMVTGSHIPDDRNGIKYTRAAGEILKEDEAGIRAQTVTLPVDRFGVGGGLEPAGADPLPPPAPDAAERYVRRYLEAFPRGCLGGLRVGLYEHSAVGRDLLYRILTGLGAEVERLARSERFLPVDTEAVRPEDAALAREWARAGRYDALVSADGDSDRPLVADEAGRWVRGDVAGIVTARFLGADAVALPVSCNTAAERCGWFRRVVRTRIGSPYVIAGMAHARAEGFEAVVGYEANGGFLTASPLTPDAGPGAGTLGPLPTRDAALVILAVLASAARRGVPVSRLLAELPARFTASDRLREFPTEASRGVLVSLTRGTPEQNRAAFARIFGGRLGAVAGLDTTDGLRATFESGEVVHLRPSGNAPEFRCYTEAGDEARAGELLGECLGVMEGWRPPP